MCFIPFASTSSLPRTTVARHPETFLFTNPIRQTIMEQKVQVLVDNVADSARAVLQTSTKDGQSLAARGLSGTDIQTSDAGRALSKDVGQLRRLVQAAITALRNAEKEDQQRENVVGKSAAAGMVPAGSALTTTGTREGNPREGATPSALALNAPTKNGDTATSIALMPKFPATGSDNAWKEVRGQNLAS